MRGLGLNLAHYSDVRLNYVTDRPVGNQNTFTYECYLTTEHFSYQLMEVTLHGVHGVRVAGHVE